MLFFPAPSIAAGLARVATVLRHEAWASAGPWGLSPTQGQILSLLHVRAPRLLQIGEVASELALSQPTVSDSVRALVAKGLVEKARSTTDRRSTELRLTSTGEDAARQAAAWPDFLLAAADSLSPAEQAVFLRGLVKMIRSLQETGRIPVARMCVSCRYFEPYVHEDETPHHCRFVDAPFGERQLRLDCGDHELATAAAQQQLWQIYTTQGETP